MRKLPCLLIVCMICTSTWAALVVPDLECRIQVNDDEPFMWTPSGTTTGNEFQFN